MNYEVNKPNINFMGLRFNKKTLKNLSLKVFNELNKAKPELKKQADCHKHLDIFITTTESKSKKEIKVEITRSNLGKFIDYLKYGDTNNEFYKISGIIPYDETYNTEIIRVLIKTIANFEKMLITRKRIEKMLKQ